MKDLNEFLKADDDEKRLLFLGTAQELKTVSSHMEKDFWVSFVLDSIFNHNDEDHPRLLFKGGTSLSKVYNLIDRFSEDIDITVFKEDLGFRHTTEDLMAMTNKPKRKLLDEMTQKCSDYIKGDFQENLSKIVDQRLSQAGIKDNQWRLEIDSTDPDGQSLAFYYPSVVPDDDQYIRKAVKLEAGCKSALDPHQIGNLNPYIAKNSESLDLAVNNVTTILPSRTLWDKFVILHSLNNRSLNGWEPNDGHRNSRHYYDVYRLMGDINCVKSMHDFDLSDDVRNHTRQYFNRGSAKIDEAKHETISLKPNPQLEGSLKRDYEAMRGMIFGAAPEFNDIVATIGRAEQRLHEVAKERGFQRSQSSKDHGIEIDL